MSTIPYPCYTERIAYHKTTPIMTDTDIQKGELSFHMAFDVQKEGDNAPAYMLTLTFTNTGSRPVMLSQSATGTDGKMDSPLFTVTLDGIELSYQGPTRDMEETTDMLTTLKPGEHFENTIDLRTYYAFPEVVEGVLEATYRGYEALLYEESRRARVEV